MNGRLTPAQVQQLAALVRSSSNTAAKFSDAGVRAGAMLGGIETVLCVAVEWAAGKQARDVIEVALREVPAQQERSAA